MSRVAGDDKSTSFFMNPHTAGFGPCTEADDLLHREMNSQVSDPALTETQYLGFSVPEAGIHALNYLWIHPNLELLTGGVWAWQGVKRSQLAAELFDMRQFMEDEPIRKGDLADYELPMGYRVKVLQPLEKIHIAYDDPARGNAFDVTLTAIMPPAMIASGKHFDQAMRTEGEVTLRGRRHRVDGYTVRDRSWGEVRPEDPRPVPPLHWVTGVFSDDFAFHMMGVEDPSTGPVWKDAFPDAGALTAINRGWIWRDGELTGLESAAITTRWNRDTGYPVAHTVRITGTSGLELSLEGTITASCSWSPWSNANMLISLARWECEGRVGWGDSQVATWTDFVHRVLG
ncbi:MAG TPA: hypothetical protein VGL92_15435 [Acidimicrobiia bacterium]